MDVDVNYLVDELLEKIKKLEKENAILRVALKDKKKETKDGKK